MMTGRDDSLGHCEDSAFLGTPDNEITEFDAVRLGSPSIAFDPAFVVLAGVINRDDSTM